MPAHICRACGVQFAPSAEPPSTCPICEDERQPVPKEGQAWTTLDDLRRDHRQDVREQEPGLHGIGCDPSFGIGQRALLLQTEDGNVLWDCTPLLDPEPIRRLGGVARIAVSHPHFHSTMVEWAEEFGAELHLTTADQAWEMRSHPQTVRWSGTHRLAEGVTLHQLGGHFEGSAVLHWNRGVLLTGDTLQVLPGRDGWLGFMRSYPMLIPLPDQQVQAMARATLELDFDRVYGGWWDRVIDRGGKEAVAASARRYSAWSSSSGTARASSIRGTIA